MVPTLLFAFGSKPVCRRMELRPNPSLALQASLNCRNDRESASWMLKFQVSASPSRAAPFEKETCVPLP